MLLHDQIPAKPITLPSSPAVNKMLNMVTPGNHSHISIQLKVQPHRVVSMAVDSAVIFLSLAVCNIHTEAGWVLLLWQSSNVFVVILTNSQNWIGCFHRAICSNSTRWMMGSDHHYSSTWCCSFCVISCYCLMFNSWSCVLIKRLPHCSSARSKLIKQQILLHSFWELHSYVLPF